MDDQQVMELVVYRLKPGNRAAFAAARAQSLADMERHGGLVAFKTLENTEDENLLMDEVWWENATRAHSAHEAWKQWPSSKLLMAVVESVTFSGHFRTGSFP